MTADDKLGCGLALGFWGVVLVLAAIWGYRHRGDPVPPPVVEAPDASRSSGDLPFSPGAM